MKAWQLTRDLSLQVKNFVLAMGVFFAALTILVVLLLFLFVVDVHTGGHIKCDTYTTHKLAKWIGLIRDSCKDQPGFSK